MTRREEGFADRREAEDAKFVSKEGRDWVMVGRAQTTVTCSAVGRDVEIVERLESIVSDGSP
jgi:hypothetical protein